MKKLSLLLALLMIFSVFATACFDGSDGDTSSEASSDVSTPVQKPPVFGIQSIGAVKENPKSAVVSSGLKYTIGGAIVDPLYPDTYNKQLTDGLWVNCIDGTYADPAWVGFATGKMQIFVDLGTVYDTLYDFKLGYLYSDSVGIGYLTAVTVSVSIDGARYDVLGDMTLPEAQDGHSHVAELKRDEYVTGRYIKYDITRTYEEPYIFLDEFEVIADIDTTSKNEAYAEAVNKAYKNLGAVAAPTTGDLVNRDFAKVLISKDCKYTITSGTVSSLTSDEGELLTNGKAYGYFENDEWVGFEANKDVTIKVDLAKTRDSIGAIEASFYANTNAGIYLPVAIKVTSYNKKNVATELGIMYGNAVLVEGSYVFTLPLTHTISARYMEFTFYATEGAQLFMLEELSVFEYVEQKDYLIYPEVVFDEETTEWGSEGSNDYINLVLGTGQQIVAHKYPEEVHWVKNTPASSKLMTDGVTSTKIDIHDGKYHKFYTGDGRTLVFDVQHLSSIDKFTMSFVHYPSGPVVAPSTVKVAVSADGKTWYNAGTINVNPSGNECKVLGELKLKSAVQARYVTFSFACANVWVGIDEVEVYGKKTTSGAKKLEASGLEETFVFKNNRIEVTDDINGGASDSCLLYQSTSNHYESDDLLPYLAYIDSEGNIIDTMFDSFIYMHYGDALPSGAVMGNDSSGVSTDWKWLVDDMFAEGTNLLAMEETAGQVKSKLGLASDYTYKLIIAIYNPNPSTTDFGDIDGDGVSENFSNYNDRIKAVKWYIDMVEAKFAEANFQNIELVGYYWFHEDMGSSRDIDQLLPEAADYIHGLDRDFSWVPYFVAAGYTNWANYGIDLTCMQPNYAFNPYSIGETDLAPEWRIKETSYLSNLYGMCVEVEIDKSATNRQLFFERYMKYLAGGIEYGYMTDTYNIYFAGKYIYRDAALLNTPLARTIYEKTYQYIKGTLVYAPEALTNLNYTCTKDTPYVIDLGLKDDVLYDFELVTVADHGSVTLNGDGTITYYPETGYTGKVNFSFVYSEYVGWSDVCDVTITVK